MIKTVLILDTQDRIMEKMGNAIREVDSTYNIEYLFDNKALLKRLSVSNFVGFVILDFQHGDGTMDGSKIIPKLRNLDKDLPIVATAEKGDVDIVSHAISSGATSFLVMGERLQERVKTLLEKIKQITELIHANHQLKEQNRMLEETVGIPSQMIGNSTQMKELFKKIKRVATIPRPVLILGERGTGKELIARMIHAESGMADRPLVCVNCAAFSDTLLESELFGYEKGAFTGAETIFQGKFEQADGGTIFFDEIGAMSLPFQQKILRVVEYGCITRVGGSKEIPVKVRILAATNANLEIKMNRGEFLRDLYDRLSFEVISVPPLRERQGDIETLAHYFLNRFMLEIPTFGGKQLSAAAIESLKRYSFPGNIRELKNIIERAAYRDTTNEISPDDLEMPAEKEPVIIGHSYEDQVQSFKRRLLQDALQKANGNQAQAARSLGLSYHQFRYFYQTVFPSRQRQ